MKTRVVAVTHEDGSVDVFCSDPEFEYEVVDLARICNEGIPEDEAKDMLAWAGNLLPADVVSLVTDNIKVEANDAK